MSGLISSLRKRISDVGDRLQSNEQESDFATFEDDSSRLVGRMAGTVKRTSMPQEIPSSADVPSEGRLDKLVHAVKKAVGRESPPSSPKASPAPQLTDEHPSEGRLDRIFSAVKNIVSRDATPLRPLEPPLSPFLSPDATTTTTTTTSAAAAEYSGGTAAATRRHVRTQSTPVEFEIPPPPPGPADLNTPSKRTPSLIGSLMRRFTNSATNALSLSASTGNPAAVAVVEAAAAEDSGTAIAGGGTLDIKALPSTGAVNANQMHQQQQQQQQQAPAAIAEKERTLTQIIQEMRESVGHTIDTARLKVDRIFSTPGVLKVAVRLRSGEKHEFQLVSTAQFGELFAEPPWEGITEVELAAPPPDSEARLNSIPVEILRLPMLRRLDLPGQRIISLPGEIGGCAGLTELSLPRNMLSMLPGDLGRLSLTKLIVSRNSLSALPIEIATLPLQLLDLSYNKFSSLLPDFFSIPSLLELNISHNEFETLPALQSGARLSPLACLDASANQLTTIPNYVFYVNTLTALNLSHNKLTFLPGFVGQLTQLQQLDVSHNQMTMVPPDMAQLTRLRALNLSGNYFRTIPQPIYGISQLQSLSVSAIKLTSMSTEILQLSSLTQLDLSENGMETLPLVLCQMEHLQNVDVSGNVKLDVLPAQIGLLPLTKLNVSKTKITQLPADFSLLTRLETLVLNNFTIGGTMAMDPTQATIKELISLARSAHHPIFASTIAELARDSESCSLMIVKEGGLDVLLSYARSELPFVRAAALVGLCNLSEFDAVPQQMVDAGIMVPLLRCLAEQKAGCELVAQTVTVLRNIAWVEGTPQLVLTAGALKPLYQIVCDAEQTVQARAIALTAIGNIALDATAAVHVRQYISRDMVQQMADGDDVAACEARRLLCIVGWHVLWELLIEEPKIGAVVQFVIRSSFIGCSCCIDSALLFSSFSLCRFFCFSFLRYCIRYASFCQSRTSHPGHGRRWYTRCCPCRNASCSRTPHWKTHLRTLRRDWRHQYWRFTWLRSRH
eukprot:TRINITY_DN1368_c0_g1_i2.p1 TRINITY_DN1368_c0_g1~~TRINITY_DN1368_c0_g1_i2.p1  ORF type:complete len:1011 (+),score=208.04 TRINITY_DN1368_c0_g1_i2:41-3073(+)